MGDSSRGRGQGSACWGVRVERVFYKSINLKRLSNADSKFFTLPNFFLPHTDTHTLAQLPPTLRGVGSGVALTCQLPTANCELLRTAMLATVQMLWQMPHMSIICLPFFLPPKPKMIRQTPMHNIWLSISPIPLLFLSSAPVCHCVTVE